MLFSVHKCHVIIWCHDVVSFESLETFAMQGYFFFFVIFYVLEPKQTVAVQETTEANVKENTVVEYTRNHDNRDDNTGGK